MVNFLTTLFKKQSLFGVFLDFPYLSISFKPENVCIAENMQPVITSNIQNRQVAATGQPYFYNQNMNNYNKIYLHNPNRYGWGTNRWFDIRDNRYNYQFIKEFKQTFHFSNNPKNAGQVKNFQAALQHAPNGTYFCHKRDIHVPYRLNHGMFTFNRGDPIDIKNIHNSLNQNRCVNTNSFNKLRWKQYELVWNNYTLHVASV